MWSLLRLQNCDSQIEIPQSQFASMAIGLAVAVLLLQLCRAVLTNMGVVLPLVRKWTFWRNVSIVCKRTAVSSLFYARHFTVAAVFVISSFFHWRIFLLILTVLSHFPTTTGSIPGRHLGRNLRHYPGRASLLRGSAGIFLLPPQLWPTVRPGGLHDGRPQRGLRLRHGPTDGSGHQAFQAIGEGCVGG